MKIHLLMTVKRFDMGFFRRCSKNCVSNTSKYEKFYEQNLFFQKYVQRQIVDYFNFKADNVNFKN